MGKLHIISQPLELTQLKLCLSRYAKPIDVLLFIGDSVTTLLDNHVFNYLEQQPYKIKLLAADSACRGVSQIMPQSLRQITDSEMVQLTISHQQIISW
jgi:sulfur relay protein TusB/DsrH